ncbi:MAG: ABC transporter ATP-binding protein [Candidatus Dormibacteraeota bacterium]|nr:ABC transporter ATP-binding protein [Candidatus Dormibacteraeota bacterium]
MTSTRADTDSEPDLLRARGLTRRYPNGLGVFDVSLVLGSGEALCLVGPNGSGKTTLLRLLATLDRPTAGEISWFGSRDRRSPRVRRRLGVLLDRPIHFEALSGWQNASFFAAQYGIERRALAARLEELFGWAGILHARALPLREYSLGMRRRLALVEAMMHEPDLLLLDEPTLALDEHGEIDLVGRLRELCAGGSAVLVATNDPVLPAALGGRRLRLEQGRVADPPAA